MIVLGGDWFTKRKEIPSLHLKSNMKKSRGKKNTRTKIFKIIPQNTIHITTLFTAL